jgi:hypothetical protein
VSPWRQILPHYDWLTRRSDLAELFGGLRAFVAGACDAPGLAGRFVFPSTVNMSIFQGPDPVDYLLDPMPRRFIVSPLGQSVVRLRYYPAGAREPTHSWEVPADKAIAIIVAGFGRHPE